MALLPGAKLGPYTIEQQLGSGGMGEVYRAVDERLHRPVAIKVLHSDKIQNEGSRQRFLKEAQSASSLNHPNIVTIHDIGSEGETVYLVMELVEGQTLGSMIPPGGLAVREAIRIASQVASAVSRAHAEGIVHRDLKPANVMVNAEGQVKILDFGLAKLLAPTTPSSEHTQTLALATTEGSIVGTAAYMSPEQAEGKAVDLRSDIFSFGVILYELITGKRPFRGESQMSVLAAVLREEPAAAISLRPEIPVDLDRLIQRCLKKDPDKRIQSMADVRVALEELQESSETIPVSESRPPRRTWMAAGALTLLALLALLMWWNVQTPQTAEASFVPVPLTTYAGTEAHPSFSPDGNQVAFSWNGESRDNSAIYIKTVGAATPLRITNSEEFDDRPYWSPNGQSIAFLRFSGYGIAAPRAGTVSLMLVPALGGEARELSRFFVPGGLLAPMTGATWSQDSRTLIVAAANEAEGVQHLWLVNAETGETKLLKKFEGPGNGFGIPILSPNGKELAVIRDQDKRQLQIWSVGPNSLLSDPRILDTGTANVRTASWTPDGNDLLLELNVNSALPLYRISKHGGKATPQMWSGNGSVAPAISAAAKRLAYARFQRDTNFYRVSLNKNSAGPPEPMANSTSREVAPHYTPDGKALLFYSNRGGSVQLWMADADGRGARQISQNDPQATSGTPRMSADGRWIAFDSDMTGQYEIYVMPAAGGVPQQITNELPCFVANWPPASQWVYFTCRKDGRNDIWRTKISEGSGSGSLEQITDTGAHSPTISPDGKWLYFLRSEINPEIWRRPLAGGKEEKLIDIVYRFNYVVTNRGVYWVSPVSTRGGEVRYLDLATRKVQTLHTITQPLDLGLTVSPDEKYLIFAQIDYQSVDLMLVENFR